MKDLHLDEVLHLNSNGIFREGFFFGCIDYPYNVYDAIVIRCPAAASAWRGLYAVSDRSLQEHIDFINQYQLKKAIVIADTLDFLEECPSLTRFRVIPADTAINHFDFSPLYRRPKIEFFRCDTEYGGLKPDKKTTVDISELPQLEELWIEWDKGTKNFEAATTLRRLIIERRLDFRDLHSIAGNVHLQDLEAVLCGLRNLSGIEAFPELRFLYLWYCKNISDISDLASVKDSLEMLIIEKCPKIKDFSVLHFMKSLRWLSLFGSNTLPDLEFLKEMPNLLHFGFDMNVTSGDLSPCLQIPSATSIRNRKHFNLKDNQLPHSINFSMEQLRYSL